MRVAVKQRLYLYLIRFIKIDLLIHLMTSKSFKLLDTLTLRGLLLLSTYKVLRIRLTVRVSNLV